MWIALALGCHGAHEDGAHAPADHDGTSSPTYFPIGDTGGTTSETTGCAAATGWAAEQETADALFAVGGDDFRNVAAADLDADGSDELVAQGATEAWLISGPYEGVRSLGATDVSLGASVRLASDDVDRDGVDDVVLEDVGAVTVLAGDGVGGVGASSVLPFPPDSSYPFEVAANDGVVAASLSWSESGPVVNDSVVWLLDGAAARTAPLDTVAHLKIDVETFYYGNQVGLPGDLTGDGVTDLVVGSGSTSAYVFDGTASGDLLAEDAVWTLGIHWDASWVGVSGNIPRDLDFDGDGTADLLITGDDATVGVIGAVWVVHGGQPTLSGPWADVAANTFLSDGFPTPVVAAISDFDGDDRSDLAVLVPIGTEYSDANVEMVSSATEGGVVQLRDVTGGEIALQAPEEDAFGLFGMQSFEAGDCDVGLAIATPAGLLTFGP